LDLTEVLAIYGAGLSTFVFLWNVVRTRRRVRVITVYGIDGEDDDLRSGLFVIIQNPSASVVHIGGLSILYPGNESSLWAVIKNSIKYRRWFPTYGWVHMSPHLVGIEDGCPVSIEPGQAHQFLVPDDVLEKIVESAERREVMVSVQDQLWNESRSKPIDVPILSD